MVLRELGQDASTAVAATAVLIATLAAVASIRKVVAAGLTRSVSASRRSFVVHGGEGSRGHR